MQPDRFEADLRTALHAEGDLVKTTMTAVELHRRAAARRTLRSLSSYPRLFMAAMVPIAAVVALAVIVILNPRTTTPVGSAPPSVPPGSPTLQSASPSPSGTTSPVPSPGVSSTLPAVLDPGSTGSLIVARAQSAGLEIVSVDPTGVELSLGALAIDDTGGASADWHVDDPLLPGFSYSNGHVVVQVSRQGATEEFANAWFDLRTPDAAPLILPPGFTRFTSDGTLVIDITGGAGSEEIRRIVDPTVPAGLSTVPPDRVGLRTGIRGVFWVAADGTGVLADRLESDNSTVTSVILGWDGSVVDAAGVALEGADGQPRPLGATGAELGQVCGDGPSGSHCGFDVTGAGISASVTIGGKDATDAVWATDGVSVFAIDASGHVVRWTSGRTTALGTAPKGSSIVSVTTDAIYLASGDVTPVVTRLPLTPGSAASTTDGIFVAVVP